MTTKDNLRAPEGFEENLKLWNFIKNDLAELLNRVPTWTGARVEIFNILGFTRSDVWLTKVAKECGIFLPEKPKKVIKLTDTKLIAKALVNLYLKLEEPVPGYLNKILPEPEELKVEPVKGDITSADNNLLSPKKSE